MNGKPADRRALLTDGEYFASELVQRIERLAEIEPNGRVHSNLQQSAAIVRRVRGLLRSEIDFARRQARIERRKVAA